MHFDRRISVRAHLTFAILGVILLSWIISGGIANYLTYRDMKYVRQEMLRHPDVYPVPFPEPKFGILDFVLGPHRSFAEDLGDRPPHFMDRPKNSPRDPQKEPRDKFAAAHQHMKPTAPGSDNHKPFPPPPYKRPFGTGLLIARMLVALILSLLAGRWLAVRFTRPLTEMEKGASAFRSGNFDYRIKISGENEFASVASTMNEMAMCVSEQINCLEEDAKRRRQFLADVAHELRSPVATMRTMAGALRDGLAEDPERKKRAVSAIVRTSERLLRLVTDLMQIAKLDLNELSLSRRRVNLREVIDSSIQTHAVKAYDAGIVLHPLASGSPVMALVDPDRLTQVLDNIFGNAINYAGSGAEVNVTLTDDDPILITISDTGRGIPQEHIPYLFDAFYQVDSARTPGESNSGLGLRIARGLINAHGGDVNLNSVEGKGTSVTISLPSNAEIVEM